jgi:hypothetical protein
MFHVEQLGMLWMNRLIRVFHVEPLWPRLLWTDVQGAAVRITA